MPGLTAEQIHQKLTAQFGDAVGALQPAKKDPFCTFKAERLVEICRFLKSDPELSFDFLQDQTATDHPKEGLIRLVYHFYSYRHHHMLAAKIELPRAHPEVDTVEGVWKSANWMEREIFDLFGVVFRGHSDLRRILLPDDWQGYPLRKDYVEAGGYHGVSNVRDNPLDLYLALDHQRRAEAAPSAPAAEHGAAAPVPEKPAAPAKPAETK